MQFKLIKEARDIRRFREIIIVLFEEGFDYLVAKAKLSSKIPFRKRVKHKLAEKKAIPPEVRLRRTLERLGPTFIKFGQMLSVRPDLIPKEFIIELEKLQDEVPPFSFEQAKKQIESELKKPLKSLFKSFDEKPIASASVSQVHKAVLKNGKKVAVKVQRPNIRNIMESDIEIMLYFAKLLEDYIPEIRKYGPRGIVQEFSDWTKKEINFELEAKNAKRFGYNFKDSKTVKIPAVYDEYTTGKILTLELIEGVELHKMSKEKTKKSDFDKIIKNGFDAILTQVFVHGLFHADPHPGNIIVMKNNVIAFVDFGIVGFFDKKLKNQSIDLLYGILSVDANKIMNTLFEMGSVKERPDSLELFQSDIRIIIEPLQYAEIGDVKLSKVLEELMDLALEYKITLPMPFVLFGKTIVTLEGVSLTYDPHFKVVKQIKPFAEKLVMRKISPQNIAKEFVEKLNEFKTFLERLPKQTSDALDKINKGSIKMDIEDTDINKLSLEIDRSSNRLAYGLIIAALLISGAMLIQVTTLPTLFGMNILSVLLFLFAGFIGLILFFSILSERKLR